MTDHDITNMARDLYEENKTQDRWATGDLGRKEATAVLATVNGLTEDGMVHEGEITDWKAAIFELANAMEQQGLSLTAGNTNRLIGNVYHDVDDSHTRHLAAQHLAEAIAQDTNDGEF